MTKEKEKVISVVVWRNIVNIWTLVFYIIALLDLYFENHLKEFLVPISIIYVTILAVYTSQKEFERWHDYNIGRHPGETYVYIWTVLIVTLFIFDFIYGEHYEVPDEVFTTYLVVLGILAITKKSKSNYIKKRK
ncbi:MAG: hypothetical protein WAX44_03940 [Minisyncoccia bacterium]